MSTPPIAALTIPEDSRLKDALESIDKNAQGIVFAVDGAGRLTGLLTDGDIRRLILAGNDLDVLVSEVMQRDFVWRHINADSQELVDLLDGRIRHIPLVDGQNKLVDYACIHRLHNIQVMEPVLTGNELSYVTECIKTNWISSQGAFVKRFEKMMGDYCGVRHSLAVNNGTAALHLALESLGVGPGDEVIVPDLTFAATINCVLHANATPVIIDVDPVSWNIAPDLIREAITSRTKAIIPVHLYGQPCAMGEILSIARAHNLFVIEDCAEALGSSIGGRMVGSFGNAAAFSFFGNKTITTGEGGMLLFRDKEVFDRAAVLRDHGMLPGKRYWHEIVGYNYRMTNLQAAVGVAQMERVEEFVRRKIEIGELYNSCFADQAEVHIPAIIPGTVNSYWLFSMLLAPRSSINRDEMMNKLLLNGVETRPLFYPLHKMPPYMSFSQGQAFPVSSDISSRGFSLPSAVTLADKEIRGIGEKIISLLEVKSLLGNSH